MAVDDTRSDSSPRSAVDTDQLERRDLEAQLAAERLEQGDVALALVTEVEVLADDDRPWR